MLADLARAGFGAATRIATLPLSATAEAVRWIAGPSRRAWEYDGRVHIDLPEERPPTEAIITALEAHPGVTWARVNEPLGRVIAELGDPAPSADEIVALLDDAIGPAIPANAPPPPALMMAVDALGFATTAVEWLFRGAPLPAELAAAVAFVESTPRLRRMIPSRFWLPLANAAAASLTPGWTGLALDMAKRVLLQREAQAKAAAWRAREGDLTCTPGRAAAEQMSLPPGWSEAWAEGPVERYADRALIGAGVGLVAGTAMTGRLRRGLQTGLAALPQAAGMGREGFSLELSTLLARRGVVVPDPQALRRLDRVDTVLVTEEAITHDQERRPGAHALEVAAKRAGLTLVVAGDDRADVLRHLISGGATVLAISCDGGVLARSACGLGVTGPDHRPPWGAHLLLPRDPEAALETAAIIIEAAATARRVSERGVTLAAAGSGVGGLFALTGADGRSATQMISAVNAAAALSFGHGVWQAHQAMRAIPAAPLPTTPWHTMPVAKVLKSLNAKKQGLSTEAVQARGGPAARREPTRLTLIRAFGEELDNPLTPALAAGAIGAAVLGSLVDAVLVGGVMGASALIGGMQRQTVDRTVAQLTARARPEARILRDGEERTIDADDLVSGDVVVLSSGDVVAADCRIIEARGLETDESSLTGESLPVRKTHNPVEAQEIAERRCMVYADTVIAAGEGKAVVVAVGEATETGRALAAAAPPRASGVETRLGEITKATTPIALGAALGITLSGVTRGHPLRQSLADGVNLAVASVPEGLPLLVSAAQLASTRRLAAHGVHARNPRTIEALGRVDVLCFDKTGTLTEGEIRLARVADAEHDADSGSLDDALTKVLVTALRATPDPESGQHSHLTDASVAEGAAAAGVERGDWAQSAALNFEPSRAYHAAAGGGVLAVKGAPEAVLPRCDLDDDTRHRIEERIEELAAAGHRVLAVAAGKAATSGRRRLTDDDVQGLTFEGLLGLADTVRETAAPAVEKLREAGVQIVMLTGDHPSTAGAIAAAVGGSRDRILTGTDIDEMSDDDLDKALPGVDVVARCTPAHKVRVVEAFQRLGRVVAMTGDGANDAAGIRLADVGIALGGNGTPAAQVAADLVVADDRLETIVFALVEGRAMWASVREALAVLVGGNLGEIGFTLLGSLVSGVSPLTARQLLLVNMLTDLAPALAIAVRAPSDDAAQTLLGEGPESSLGEALTREIAERAAVTATGAALAWVAARFTGTAARARTAGLVALVGTQLAQTLAAGGRDRAVLISAVGSWLALTAIVQTPGVSGFFGCVPLGPLAWAIAVGSIAAAMMGGRMFQGLSPGSGTVNERE